MDEKDDPKGQTVPLRETAHKVWLAGLGALTAADEQGRQVFQRLMDRGREVFEASRVGDVDEEVIRALHRLGVPTRTEIAELTRRIEELDALLAKLESKAQAKVETRSIEASASYGLPGDSGTDPR